MHCAEEERLEIAVGGGRKGDHNRHDFTQAEPPGALSLHDPVGHQLLPPAWVKGLTKIVAMTKQS
jgi:hypothetical protein